MMNCDRCCEDRAWCRSCPEKCYPDDEPTEAKEPTPFDRITQWVSRTKLPDLLAQIAKTFQRMKEKE